MRPPSRRRRHFGKSKAQLKSSRTILALDGVRAASYESW